MDKPQSQFNMLARKVLIAAESGEAQKFKGLFTGRQPDEIQEALTDLSQERFNDVLGNVWFTPFIAGAWHGHQEVLDTLIADYKVDVNQIGYITHDGRKMKVTALCAAVRQRNYDIVQHLLDKGADINLCCPLAVACHCSDVKGARLLIKNKADVNARNDEGITCLMTACERYYLYVVSILVNNGADTRLEDMDGNTALHRLALKKRMYVLKNGPLPQIIEKLVMSGAQMSTNQAGQTPLDAACASGNVEVARTIMCLPEVRPEEQLTAQVKLNQKLESDMKQRTSWIEKFKTPRELRKMKWTKSKKSAAEKTEASNVELNKKLESDMKNGEHKTSWGEEFKNPSEFSKMTPKSMKSKKSAAEKTEASNADDNTELQSEVTVMSGAQMSTNQAGQTPPDAACASGNVEVGSTFMCLPEVRPEEQPMTQGELNEKFESDMKNGEHKTSWGEEFKNPSELSKMTPKSMKSKKSAAEKTEASNTNDNTDLQSDVMENES
ncbi:uncharacterized protein [Diadema antillarum]|uniref:uncharacterized protein n=1 Tax=Diadema antillarum TaxID=105358 RepID=UPI003A889932